MADPWAAITEAIIANWKILAIIILSVTTIVPWVALAIFNFFNHNIWQEITSVIDRKKIKLFWVLQNGSGAMLYRKMRPDRQILLKEDKKNGHHELILPTTPPINDFNSHRQLYIAVEGVEGTRNILAETNYDVNTPMKTMGHTMSFEAGREFERTYNPQGGLFSLMNLIQVGIPLIFLIVLLIVVFSQGTTLAKISESLAANSTTLEAIRQTLETNIVIGGRNAANAISIP